MGNMGRTAPLFQSLPGVAWTSKSSSGLDVTWDRGRWAPGIQTPRSSMTAKSLLRAELRLEPSSPQRQTPGLLTFTPDIPHVQQPVPASDSDSSQGFGRLSPDHPTPPSPTSSWELASFTYLLSPVHCPELHTMESFQTVPGYLA